MECRQWLNVLYHNTGPQTWPFNEIRELQAFFFFLEDRVTIKLAFSVHGITSKCPHGKARSLELQTALHLRGRISSTWSVSCYLQGIFSTLSKHTLLYDLHFLSCSVSLLLRKFQYCCWVYYNDTTHDSSILQSGLPVRKVYGKGSS